VEQAAMSTVESVNEKDPYDILTSIGLTGGESRDLMKRIEAERRNQTRRLFVSTRKSSTWLRRVVVVFWVYSLIVWVYVIAMQLRYPESPYWPLAQWLPVRLDYLGELAFFFSFIFGIFAITMTTRQARDIKKLQELMK
jgi:hypothetical protein